MHELTLLLLLPVMGAAVIAVLPNQYATGIRTVALIAAAAAMVQSWLIFAAFDTSTAQIQFFEQTTWNPRLGTSYALAIDGISLAMLLLATLLCLIAIMASTCIKHNIKGYYLLVLLLESAILGVFMAQDWSLF